MVNRRVRGVQSGVTVDDAGGAALATKHLADLGHTEIAGIFGPAAIDTTRQRLAGFLAQGERAGIRTLRIETNGFDPLAGNSAALEIFKTHRRVTAIFASTFAIGMGVHRAARQRGVRIPEDISLIALHDSELAEYLSPALTTVGLPVEEMAHRAVDLLVDLIHGGAPRRVVIKTTPGLMLRESTSGPRNVKQLARADQTARGMEETTMGGNFGQDAHASGGASGARRRPR